MITVISRKGTLGRQRGAWAWTRRSHRPDRGTKKPPMDDPRPGKPPVEQPPGKPPPPVDDPAPGEPPVKPPPDPGKPGPVKDPNPKQC